MEIPQIRVGSESKSAEGACADKAGGHGGSAEFHCARGIAQAEGVLREISSGRRRRSELSSSVGQKAESAFLVLRQLEAANPIGSPIGARRSSDCSTCD